MPRALAAGMSIASMPTPYLTIPLQLRRRSDHLRRDRCVAHQDQIGVGDRGAQVVLGDAVGQRHEVDATRAQTGIDAWTFELGVGSNRFDVGLVTR